MGHRDQTATAVGGPVGDPAGVGPAHRLRILDGGGIGFPGKVEAWIDDGGVESFFVETSDPVLGVAGAQRNLLAVFDARIEISGVAGDLTHLRDATEVTAAIDARRYAVDFQVFESVRVFLHPDGVGAVL